MILTQNQIELKDHIVVIPRETLYVGFGGHKVAVCLEAQEVLTGIERKFCEMIEYGATKTVKQLEVFKKNGKYHFPGDNGSYVSGRSLTGLLNSLSKEIIHHLVLANPEYLWVHAGAVAYDGKGVLFFGSWGSGKSTLVTNLCKYGWDYLSDDISPLNIHSSEVIPFPETPVVRKNAGKEISLHYLGDLQKIEIDIEDEKMCQKSIPIGAIAFPNYSFNSSCRISCCSLATAAQALIERCLNFTDHRGRAVHFLCDLVKRLPAVQITFNRGEPAAKQITNTYKQWCRNKF